MGLIFTLIAMSVISFAVHQAINEVKLSAINIALASLFTVGFTVSGALLGGL